MQRAAIGTFFVFLVLAAWLPAADGSSISTIEPAAGESTASGKETDLFRNGASGHETRRQQHVDPELLLRIVSMEEICATLAAIAVEYELPLPFFARLIWQESRFRPEAVSRSGARGIAQFMPATAQWRGLSDPHDPIQSLHKSADYLRELRSQFGNLGLAAAAYNGGSGRVEAWLKGKGGLPRETRQYVEIVTGLPVDEWRVADTILAVKTTRIPGEIPCPALVVAASHDLIAGPQPTQRTIRSPIVQNKGWWVVLGGHFSRARALIQITRLQRQFPSALDGREPMIVTGRIPGRGRSPISVVRVDEPDRASANRLCARLRAGGASCMVVRTS